MKICLTYSLHVVERLCLIVEPRQKNTGTREKKRRGGGKKEKRGGRREGGGGAGGRHRNNPYPFCCTCDNWVVGKAKPISILIKL